MRHLFTKITTAILTITMMLTGGTVSTLAADQASDNVRHYTSAVVASGGGISVDTGASIVVSEATVNGTSKDKSVSLVISHKNGSGKLTGYELYKKNKTTGDWSRKAIINKRGRTTYKDRDVSYNRTYAYRVRAFYKDSDGKNHYGDYSSTARVKVSLKVASARLESVMPGQTSVKLSLSHKKNSGKITGYVVYKKNKNGKWVRKAQIKKSGTTSYVDTDVSYKGSYTYRVRAYFKDSDGKIHYGSYSKAIKARVTIHRVEQKVTDKNSALYGKTVVLYKFGDGSTVQEPTKYVKIKAQKYELYVNKSRQYVTVYAVNDGKMTPIKTLITSTGRQAGWTPEGTFYTQAKYRWHLMSGGVYCQWLTRITDSYLFHSECYRSTDNNTLLVNGYNRLGSVASHGCVRLQAQSAKWIYDNCPIGTKVVIYSKSGYEPLNKPSIGKLPLWHTWDPTDPTAQKYCKQHKCHNYAKK